MDRWDELERIGRLHAEGLLSDDEFASQKARLLHPDDRGGMEHATTLIAGDGAGRRLWRYAAFGLAAAILMVAIAFLMLRPGSDAHDTSPKPVASIDATNGISHATASLDLRLRSNVPGASLVKLSQLPATTPYGDASDDYCGERIRAATTGGRLAETLGWRVVKEVPYSGLNAVLIVRGYEPGTSGHCFAKDPNLALFTGPRLIGVLFSKGPRAIGMNDVEVVDDHLRVRDDLSPVGQVTLKGTDLAFDRVRGSDGACDGRYRVPAVFNVPWSNARRVLAASGWIVRPGNEDAVDDDRTSEYRLRFPETESCSGTGYAYCSFRLHATDGVGELVMTTAGDGPDPTVVNYEVSCENGTTRQ